MDMSLTINTLGFLGNQALDLGCLKTIQRALCSNHMWNRERVAGEKTGVLGTFLPCGQVEATRERAELLLSNPWEV